jgi:DNA-binding NarL/FixJ family response regulator
MRLPVEPSERHGSTKLTPTEARVVELVCQGLKNPAIGQELGITRLTVVNHLRRVFDKLGCFNRVELALRATAMNLYRPVQE